MQPNEAVIAELVELAKQMRESRKRGEQLGLTEDEEAFYEALEVNDSAVAVLGDKALCAIARELVDAVRRNVTIDWSVKESVRAKIRALMVRRAISVHRHALSLGCLHPGRSARVQRITKEFARKLLRTAHGTHLALSLPSIASRLIRTFR